MVRELETLMLRLTNKAGVAYYIVMDYKYMKRKAGLRCCLLKMNGKLNSLTAPSSHTRHTLCSDTAI
ncbi:hypothetical protein CsSME_00000573 [Camellia sinensis var. sinensis]